MLDYIIVGSGLAGISFAEICHQRQQTFLVIDKPIYNASRIACGLYNPVILKRFSLAWKADEHLEYAIEFYKNLETKYQSKFIYENNVHRIIHDIQEQNEWHLASDKIKLSKFLNPQLRENNQNNIHANYKLGEILNSGFVDVGLLINKITNKLKANKLFEEALFDYDSLKIFKDYVQYKNHKAKHIIFAEGYGMLKNPFFKQLPLEGTKGDVITIRSESLMSKNIYKKNKFIIPQGNDTYKIGATYNWEAKTETPCKLALQELIEGVQEITSSSFTIINHESGVRPTVKDRKPLIGKHPKFKNISLINGLGTRGVIIAPNMANNLWEHINEGKPLDIEADIKRFNKIIW